MNLLETNIAQVFPDELSLVESEYVYSLSSFMKPAIKSAVFHDIIVVIARLPRFLRQRRDELAPVDIALVAGAGSKSKELFSLYTRTRKCGSA
jgi:hypothetical protein